MKLGKFETIACFSIWAFLMILAMNAGNILNYPTPARPEVLVQYQNYFAILGGCFFFMGFLFALIWKGKIGPRKGVE